MELLPLLRLVLHMLLLRMLRLLVLKLMLMLRLPLLLSPRRPDTEVLQPSDLLGGHPPRHQLAVAPITVGS